MFFGFLGAMGIVALTFMGIDCDKSQQVTYEQCVEKPHIVYEYPH